MIKVFATNVVVSKGYNNSPALKFSDNGEHVRFRIGQKVYDSREDDNTRWNNYTVKAFGPLCERIQKMQVKEGSFINLVGDLDEDVWTDEETGEIKRDVATVLFHFAEKAGKFEFPSGTLQVDRKHARLNQENLPRPLDFFAVDEELALHGVSDGREFLRIQLFELLRFFLKIAGHSHR